MIKTNVNKKQNRKGQEWEREERRTSRKNKETGEERRTRKISQEKKSNRK